MNDFSNVHQALQYLKSNTVFIMPEMMLVIWALGILIVDFFIPKEKKYQASYFALMGVVASSVALFKIGNYLYSVGPLGTAFEGTMVLDWFSLVFKVIVLINAAISIIISIKYLDIEGEQTAEYYALILFATIGMMFMASGVDLITIFIGLELMAICEFILVGIFRGDRKSNEAALKFFLLGTFSTGLLLYGMSLLYGFSGSTNLHQIVQAILATGLAPSSLLVLAMIMLIAGLGFKIAAVPFHMWCPDTYEGAPTSVTAFISVGPKAASFAVLFRILIEGVGPLTYSRTFLFLLAVIAALTMTWANVAAITQSNVKRLFAYSTISHAGFLLLGLIAGKESDGISAAIIYLLIYAFMNLGAFTVIVALRRREIIGDRIADFSGLISKSPGATILMTVFLASLAGIPPTAGFIAKYFIFASLINAYFRTQSKLMSVLAVIAVLNAVVAFYYYWLIVKTMYISEPTDELKLSFSPGLVTALIITLIFTLGIGLYPEPFIKAATLPFR